MGADLNRKSVHVAQQQEDRKRPIESGPHRLPSRHYGARLRVPSGPCSTNPGRTGVVRICRRLCNGLVAHARSGHPTTIATKPQAAILVLLRDPDTLPTAVEEAGKAGCGKVSGLPHPGSDR